MIIEMKFNNNSLKSIFRGAIERSCRSENDIVSNVQNNNQFETLWIILENALKKNTYHNLDRITELFEFINFSPALNVGNSQTGFTYITNPVMISLFLQNIIYSPFKPESKIKSTQWAQELLKEYYSFPDTTLNKITNIILASSRLKCPLQEEDYEIKLIHDLRNTRLAYDWDDFHRNMHLVRQEYKCLTNKDFYRINYKFFNFLSSQKELFCTPAFKDNYTERAKFNINKYRLAIQLDFSKYLEKEIDKDLEECLEAIKENEELHPKHEQDNFDCPCKDCDDGWEKDEWENIPSWQSPIQKIYKHKINKNIYQIHSLNKETGIWTIENSKKKGLISPPSKEEYYNNETNEWIEGIDPYIIMAKDKFKINDIIEDGTHYKYQVLKYLKDSIELKNLQFNTIVYFPYKILNKFKKNPLLKNFNFHIGDIIEDSYTKCRYIVEFYTNSLTPAVHVTLFRPSSIKHQQHHWSIIPLNILYSQRFKKIFIKNEN
jgi:predicted metal-dependent HD superfamily phosphohydrolase